MQITFEGHACIRVNGSKNIIIDPFLTGNPSAVKKPSDIKADFVLVTHAHADHFGDTLEIAKNNDATIVAVNELAKYTQQQGCRAHGMNIGGKWDFNNGLKVKVTQALHSSSFENGEDCLACGEASGFLFWLDGKCLYHAGDTGLFSDMSKIIGKHEIDVAFIPIGGNYTMGPVDALTAVGWLGCKTVVPIHYNTMPLIHQDAKAFKLDVEGKLDTRCLILEPGESFEL